MPDHERSDCSCSGLGYYQINDTQIPCGQCQPDQPAVPAIVHTQALRSRHTEIAVLVDELLHSWTDRDRDKHVGLLALLAVHGQPVRMDSRSGHGGKVTGSPAPWANDVEELLTTIYAGALEHEQTLRILLGYQRTHRSSTSRSAANALRTLPDLYQAAFDRRPEHWLIAGRVDEHGRRKRGGLEHDLSSWHRQAREVLGAEKRWTRVPTTCSACGKSALRQMPRDGSVICTSCGARWAESELGWLDDMSTRPTTTGAPA